MSLDIFTVLVGCCAVLLLLGGTFIFFWLQDRRSPWLLCWGIPLIVGGVFFALYLRPNWDVGLPEVVFGNAVRILVVGFLWQGARLFEQRKPAILIMAMVLIGWLALCSVPEFINNIAGRMFVVSAANGTFCLLAGWELWRGRQEKLQSRMASIYTFGLLGLALFGRGLFAVALPFPFGVLPIERSWMGAFVLGLSVLATFMGILLISITKERREAEQRNFALYDPLTGLMNRRAFMDYAERVARRRNFGHAATTLLVLDLDEFKGVNDQFGHDVGDRMLAAFAAEAEANVRPNDQLFRIGGEEFCFVLPDTGLGDALIVAERIRRGFEAVRLNHNGLPVHCTVSVGIATTNHAGFDLDVLLNAADAAVYEAKARGRNRIVVSEPASLSRPAVGMAVRRRRA